MSTRSCIARPLPDGGFRGVYHHWDGYPTGLGKTLWGLYHEGPFVHDLPALCRTLIDEHPAGWSSINGADWSLPVGYSEWSQLRCAACGRINDDHWEDYAAYRERVRALRTPERPFADEIMNPRVDAQTNRRSDVLGHEFVYPEVRQPQCYCHGDRAEEAQPVTEQDDLGMEWGYLLSEEANTITVIERVYENSHMVGMFGSGVEGQRWVHRGTFNLEGPEPNWKQLEERED